MDQNKGINAKIDDLLKYREKEEDEKRSKLKKKRFKLPAFIKKRIGKPRYRNYALVVFLRRNREVDMKFIEVLNDAIMIEDKCYDARADCYYTYGKSRIPTLILPEWNLRPIGTLDYQHAVERGETVDAQDITIKAHERMEAEAKKRGAIDPKMIVIIVIIAIIAGYFLMKK